MKKQKIFVLTLLATALVAGCSKTEPGPDTDGAKAHISIFTNQMDGSKTSINPANPGDGENWIAGETVTLNNNTYPIVQVGDHYGIETAPLDVDMTSFYPGTSFGHNQVEVIGNEIVMHRLAVHFQANAMQTIAFPMVATAAAGADRLYYNHLSGGIQVNLQNGRSNDVTVASVTIMAQSTTNVVNLGYTDEANTYTARWAVEGPQVPLGPVGDNDDEVDVKYASVMNFDLYDDIDPGINIAADCSLQFCIPITISSVKSLRVVGYDADGNELFNVKKSFGTEVTMERNQMKAFPTITIN